MAFEKRQYPEIIIFKGKHGDSYYLAHNPKEFGEIFLKVLKERFDEGYYKWMDGYVPYQLQELKPDYSLADIDALPVSMEKEANEMRHKLKVYQDKLREQREALRTYALIKETIESSLCQTAYALLREFSSNQYEEFNIEHPIPILKKVKSEDNSDYFGELKLIRNYLNLYGITDEFHQLMNNTHARGLDIYSTEDQKVK